MWPFYRPKTVLTLLEEILMNQEELLVSLNSANAQTQKIIGEIQALQVALANSTATVSPEVEAAVNQLLSNLKVADDLNPDVPA